MEGFGPQCISTSVEQWSCWNECILQHAFSYAWVKESFRNALECEGFLVHPKCFAGGKKKELESVLDGSVMVFRKNSPDHGHMASGVPLPTVKQAYLLPWWSSWTSRQEKERHNATRSAAFMHQLAECFTGQLFWQRGNQVGSWTNRKSVWQLVSAVWGE